MKIEVLVATILHLSVANAVEISQCIAPLGMETGAISNEDITASSSFDSGNVGPHHGRMRQERNGGAWCPKLQITKEPKEWIQIDLHQVHLITATGSQGRFGNGQGVEYAEAYMLEYWRPKLGKWFRYRDYKGEEVITANTNTYLEAKYTLNPPVWASKIRFLPYSYHRRTVCMRVEIYGCNWNDGVVSYSIPQGDKRGTGWEFFDATYDGHWDGELKRGLGQLTDGKVGPDNFKAGYYDQGQGWVGWRNDTRDGQPIEVKFEFDQVREFTDVHIYCNNQFTRDVQVFSEAKIWFSIGGEYYTGEPIVYTYMEDRIFETSRNISIKLHHRVGQFVKIQLSFASKWIMISEIMFDSGIAHGNFNVETPVVDKLPVQSDEHTHKHNESDTPISTAKPEDPIFMAIVISILMAIIFLLAASIFVIINRHRQRKCFASPLTAKSRLEESNQLNPACATAEKSAASVAYGITNVEDCTHGKVSAMLNISGRSTLISSCVDNMDMRLDEYQEPYQALKYAPYYSYSAVVMEMKDMMPNKCDDSSYDYAVPEVGTIPLLSSDSTLLVSNQRNTIPDANTTMSKLEKNVEFKTLNQNEILNALKVKLENTVVPEFPRHRLRMVSKLAEGTFGTVYIAEADGIPEYGSSATLGKRLVAVKFLLQDAAEQDKQYFHRDVRILAALEDINISRVLGICSCDDPICVIMEYLEHGDLCTFLKSHLTVDNRILPLEYKAISFNCLLYIATQISSGMRYLESLNFVHRDLATRNCLVGKAYQIKISDFGTGNEVYASDYYKVDGNIPLPIRWMAWESVFLGKYTTKSDVWSFAVTMWEILTLARRQPYDSLTDPQVLENLAHMHHDNGQFSYLPKTSHNVKDIYELMCECWRRNASERPTFQEIHLFLQRKNLGYAPI